MSDWSTDSNWFNAFLMLAFVVLFLLGDLRDASRRKNELGEIAKNLSDEIRKLKNQ